MHPFTRLRLCGLVSVLLWSGLAVAEQPGSASARAAAAPTPQPPNAAVAPAEGPPIHALPPPGTAPIGTSSDLCRNLTEDQRRSNPLCHGGSHQ